MLLQPSRARGYDQLSREARADVEMAAAPVAPPRAAGSSDSSSSSSSVAPGGQYSRKPSATSSWKVPEEEWYANVCPQGMTDENRANFIRKVFGILAFQMSITVAICLASMFVHPVQILMVKVVASFDGVGLYIWFALYICSLCALMCFKSRFPTNYIALVAFTVVMTVPIAGICAMYQMVGAGILILQAFVATVIVFGSLSAYTLISGTDFTWMGGMLSAGLSGMITYSFFAYVLGFSTGILYSFSGVMLFSGYVLYDTSRLLHIYGPDDAILAAVELYLDILMLFLYILEILSEISTWFSDSNDNS